MAPEMSQTLDRGLEVLDVLARYPAGLSVTELSGELNVSRTIVYRLVVTLEQRGFVRRTQDGRCRLGIACVTLARQIQPVLRDAALPVLRRLADQIGATAHLSIIDGTESQAVAVAEPSRTEAMLKPARPVGRVVVERGVAGRAAVATRTSNRNMRPGWVVSGGSATQGGYAVAAPVLGVEGLEASVGILSPVELDTGLAGPQVVQAATDIARILR